jgi:hypothetical protein
MLPPTAPLQVLRLSISHLLTHQSTRIWQQAEKGGADVTAGLASIERRVCRLEQGIQPDISDKLVDAVLRELSDFDLDALNEFSILRECGYPVEQAKNELTRLGRYEDYIEAKDRFDEKYRELAAAANLLQSKIG